MKELNNPELDQLSGRFGHQRGFFGMLLCRRMDDRGRIIARCRDAASDGRGYMLVLEDADLRCSWNTLKTDKDSESIKS